jgi:hypothetical protein
MRTLLLVGLVMVLVGGVAAAQSNEVIDDILEQDAATFGQAAYIVLLGAGEAPEDASVEEVYGSISWSDWNLEQKSMDEAVTLGELSYLVMESFGISGGIMYRIVPGPRYAARELDYLDFFIGSGSPYRTVSGQEMLHVMGQALDFAEEGA